MKRKIPFEKYEASGNDFVILDFFEFELIDLKNRDLIQKICDRHFGVGADGLIALCSEEGFDFRMKYFNSDGQASSFCGNGSRAAIRYMMHKQAKFSFSFIATDGIHAGFIEEELVSVKMRDIPTFVKTPYGSLIESGSPHLIVEVEDPFKFPVNEEGRLLRHKFDPEGVNVNFIKCSGSKLEIATYERGVEWETLACGTGVTASAYYKCFKDGLSGEQVVPVKAKGGELEVKMTLNGSSATEIWLKGEANKVFSGFYDLF
ncbi:MAG: diaminopimelate epimerase [Saprospiraceae bacterium]|nr:diaminopimelate epimerase [Saprospiraceae bacterium]MBK9221469.1 diaminopimelate epimerase [Saprospiraceae bacterium]MBK9721593.1 diaminopimelate epimerase [Saprospiraceae bacterium]